MLIMKFTAVVKIECEKLVASTIASRNDAPAKSVPRQRPIFVSTCWSAGCTIFRCIAATGSAPD